MSTKPNPVACTAAMLALRLARASTHQGKGTWSIYEDQQTMADAAILASDLHRFAKAAERLAVAECNGEWRDGQRDWAREQILKEVRTKMLAELDASITKEAGRLDRKLAKINERLAPFRLVATRHGDPRGFVVKLATTDRDVPHPHNEMGGEWGIG